MSDICNNKAFLIIKYLLIKFHYNILLSVIQYFNLIQVPCKIQFICTSIIPQADVQYSQESDYFHFFP